MEREFKTFILDFYFKVKTYTQHLVGCIVMIIIILLDEEKYFLWIYC